ncbi:MAG: PilT/PilU family type 4a pilus ATPase [Candidatus Magasanikbacteria bacterium]
MKSLSSYFDFAIKHGASDLHLVGEEKGMIRKNGELKPIQKTEIPNKELEKEIFSILNAEQKKTFEENHELDISHDSKDTRFRINIHRQEGNIGLAARLIPKKIPTPDELGFTASIERFTSLNDGLVLVVGPAGQGKSTTIASMIQQINESRKEHIVTIEDPIEFLFEADKSLIEQREVGVDTPSFASALKHVLRQDPDIILVGEMRDPETIATALTAAETGHLVFSTLHTSTAADAIERIIDAFEGGKQKQILTQLSSVLRGIIAQQLLPTIDGTLVAAREVMVNTPAIANLIRENNISQIESAIQTGRKKGMMTMKAAIEDLIFRNIVDEEVVRKYMLSQWG